MTGEAAVKRYEYRREPLWLVPSELARPFDDFELDALLARLGAEGWLLVAMDGRNAWFAREVSA